MIVNYFPNDLFVYRKPHKHDCSLRFIGRSDDLKILKIQCVIIMHAAKLQNTRPQLRDINLLLPQSCSQ